ncbi:MAG: amidohydrolase family protein, partial [Planctomycetia bacterium]|nr:amidohydrolase family protein [Planctomycetia bacterium]
MSTSLSRREFLIATGAAAVASATAAAAEPKRLLIDTHLEVWTLDPKFPFNHPEAGRNLKVDVAAPIENQVEQMREFGLKYAVLINPRLFGWDNSYIAHSLKSYPKLFVAHGLLEPEDPKIVEKLRYWMQEHGFQGMRFSPIYHPKSTWLNSPDHYPLWREA